VGGTVAVNPVGGSVTSKNLGLQYNKGDFEFTGTYCCVFVCVCVLGRGGAIMCVFMYTYSHSYLLSLSLSLSLSTRTRTYTHTHFSFTRYTAQTSGNDLSDAQCKYYHKVNKNFQVRDRECVCVCVSGERGMGE
jgi:hypothetical protein